MKINLETRKKYQKIYIYKMKKQYYKLKYFG